MRVYVCIQLRYGLAYFDRYKQIDSHLTACSRDIQVQAVYLKYQYFLYSMPYTLYIVIVEIVCACH